MQSQMLDLVNCHKEQLSEESGHVWDEWGNPLKAAMQQEFRHQVQSSTALGDGP